MNPARLLGLAALAALIAASGTLAAPPPSAGDTLRDAARGLVRSGSYHVTVRVVGGVATGADHRIASPVTDQCYEADVIGGVTRVESPLAFRTARGGAIQNENRWVSILATDEGRLLDRLFEPLDRALEEAVALRRLATFLGEGDDPAAGEAQSEGGTTARDREGDEVASRHIRIDGPPETALERFLEIQNSGCMSAG